MRFGASRGAALAGPAIRSVSRRTTTVLRMAGYEKRGSGHASCVLLPRPAPCGVRSGLRPGHPFRLSHRFGLAGTIEILPGPRFEQGQQGRRRSDRKQRGGGCDPARQPLGLRVELRVLERAVDIERASQADRADVLGARLELEIEALI